jgi:hypothetical protein
MDRDCVDLHSRSISYNIWSQQCGCILPRSAQILHRYADLYQFMPTAGSWSEPSATSRTRGERSGRKCTDQYCLSLSIGLEMDEFPFRDRQ